MFKKWRKIFLIFGAILFLSVVAHKVKYQEKNTRDWESILVVSSIIIIVRVIESEREY